MQAKLQSRLSMIRCNEQNDTNSKFDANLAVTDYRFKSSLHQILREQLVKNATKPKPIPLLMSKRRKIKKVVCSCAGCEVTGEQQNDSTSSSSLQSSGISHALKGKVIRKVPVFNCRTKTKNKVRTEQLLENSEQAEADPNLVLDLSNHMKKSPVNNSKKNVGNVNPKKPVHDLLQERIAKKNKQVSPTKPQAAVALDFSTLEEPCEHEDSEAVSPKIVYMTELGLLQRPASSVRCVNNDAPMVPIGTICIQPNNQEGSINSDQNFSNSDSQVKPVKKSSETFPKIRPLKVNTRKTSPKKYAAKKSPRKNLKQVCVNEENDPGHASDTSPQLNIAQEQPAVILYESVATPSLGPFVNQFHNQMITMSQEESLDAIELLDEIKQEPQDEPQEAPIDYSMKEYDSLRALASVYLGNKRN